jgi:hypothetical protein
MDCPPAGTRQVHHCCGSAGEQGWSPCPPPLRSRGLCAQGLQGARWAPLQRKNTPACTRQGESTGAPPKHSCRRTTPTLHKDRGSASGPRQGLPGEKLHPLLSRSQGGVCAQHSYTRTNPLPCTRQWGMLPWAPGRGLCSRLLQGRPQGQSVRGSQDISPPSPPSTRWGDPGPKTLEEFFVFLACGKHQQRVKDTE